MPPETATGTPDTRVRAQRRYRIAIAASLCEVSRGCSPLTREGGRGGEDGGEGAEDRRRGLITAWRGRYSWGVSEQLREPSPSPAGSMTIEELAEAQGARPVVDAHELAADIWESDEELDAFLADLRRSRDAS